MAQTVGTHGVAVFTSPSNGDTLDATVVKGNDNNLRSAYVDHDADGGLHVQSSSFATRSSPGSLGRKWLTTDTNSYRLFFDDGSAWYELSYLSTNGGTVTGNMTVTGTLTASVTGPVTGNASTATALQTARNINGVAFNGTADITVTAAADTLSGSTLNSGVTASSLTSVGTLSTLQVSGNAAFDTNTLFVDSVNNRVGVGTAAPTNALDVAGSARVRSELILDGVTKRYRIYSSSSDELFFARDTSAGVFEAVPLRIDVSGNLGLGVTPSAWTNIQKAFETSYAGNSVYSGTGANNFGITSNSYFSTGWKYGQTGFANRINIGNSDGSFAFFNAPSGIAGNAVTWTQAMTLNASGQLGIGTTTPALKLHVTVENGSVLAATDNGVRVASDLARLQMSVTGQTYSYGGVGANSALVYSLNRLNLVADSVSPITFHTGTTVPVERMRLDATGNLGLGVTPSSWKSDWRSLDIQSGGGGFASSSPANTVITNNAFVDAAANWIYKAAYPAQRYALQSTGAHAWFTAPSGTAGAAISFTQAMTLDASGNLLVGTTSAGYGLAGRGLVEVNGSSSSLLGLKVGDVAKGYIQHTGTDLTLANQAAGSISFVTNNVSRWGMNSSGHLLAATDATYDIGAVGARPKDVYLSGNVVGGGWVRAGAASAGVAATTTIGSTTATTVGATGAAAALPANPLGYIIAHVGTTQVKIPYYTA